MNDGGEALIYGVIVGTKPEATEYMNLSYEDVLNILIGKLLSDEGLPLTVWRRCCSSVHEHTMSVEICGEIRELVGLGGGSEKGGDISQIRKKLDIAVNNWYLRGKISLSEEDVIGPSDHCGVDG
ncbi:MAG: hypothetical protein FWG41_03615 [Methanomassiliicoccaceae archaeon]|nr:hypothetical protein [Methanomassiliicoccaceae archaeon]